MPYIKQENRKVYDKKIKELLGHLRAKDHPGELNYVITRLCELYTEDMNYERLNAAIGVLECAKLELYRRTCLYEDQKIKENGDTKIYQEIQNKYSTTNPTDRHNGRCSRENDGGEGCC